MAILYLCCTILLLLPLSVTSEEIVCYTNWLSQAQGVDVFTPEDIDPNLCTQIIYAFAVLDESSFMIKSRIPQLDIDRGYYQKIVNLKRRNEKLKVLIALGGWKDSKQRKYSKMVANWKLRAVFIESAVKFLKNHGFDGLDLDWEYPTWDDKRNFAVFVKELKIAFKPCNYLLTAAVSASKWKINEAYDVKSLGQDLDQIHIMAYDLKSAWDYKTGHHAPIYSEDGLSDDGAVTYFISLGAPKEKLILGMPFYGRTWILANADDNGLGARSERVIYGGDDALAYREICSRTWTKTVSDPNGKIGPYAYLNKLWTSFDDAESLKRKVEYLKSRGLGGAMVWMLSQDDYNGTRCKVGRFPLLIAINNAMRNMTYCSKRSISM